MANLLYGQDNHSGHMISIYEAQNGLKCLCICPSCKKQLVAKQGPNKTWHFAHASGVDCGKAEETAIHKLSKEIVGESRHIILPGGRSFLYDNVKIEGKLDDLRPDAWISNETESIAIEIFVSNAVKPRKLAQLAKKGITMLEIDLSNVTRNISKEDLAEIVIKGQALKVLYCPPITSEPDPKVERGRFNFSNWIANAIIFVSVIIFLRIIWVVASKRRR